jgi:AmmeMemoRadiSam system protein B
MTHYEPHEQAAKKDRIALSAVEGLDEAGFYSAVESNNVSACGHGPIASLIVAARRLGAKEAKLLSYNTSGDVIGDRSSVVGYAALSFTKM